MSEGRYEINFPPKVGADGGPDQDEEWCEVRIDGDVRRIRFHDYDDIYKMPGLYEQLFYEELKCASPGVVCGLLTEQAEAHADGIDGMRILDVGAGNGMVGEELKRLGAGAIVGVDIIAEAYEAVERDRPDVYEDYVVGDLTALGREESRRLEEPRFDGLTCVAALGFDDIPPEAFAAAYELVEEGGLIALCLKDEFVGREDPSGFSRMIRKALDDGTMTQHSREKYRHRLSALGEPLDYVAVIAEKQGDLPVIA